MCLLDPILNRVPAWRAFFVDPWSPMTMTPEKHTKATQLETRHRLLVLDLKAWQAQADAPIMVPMSPQSPAVPIDLWLALKNGMVKHLQGLVAKNRAEFEAL